MRIVKIWKRDRNYQLHTGRVLGFTCRDNTLLIAELILF